MKKAMLSEAYITIMKRQALDEISVAAIPEDLDLVESIYLKKGGRLEMMTRGLRTTPITQRSQMGHLINDFKVAVTSALHAHRERFAMRSAIRAEQEFQKNCPFGQEIASQCTPQRYHDCMQCAHIDQHTVEFKPMRANQVKQHALYYVAAQARQAAHDVRNDDRFMVECARIADELQKRADELGKK